MGKLSFCNARQILMVTFVYVALVFLEVQIKIHKNVVKNMERFL